MPRPPADKLPLYTDDVQRAFKALAAGKASEGQQQLALEWLVKRCCETNNLSMRFGGEDARRETDFAEGKRFVGIVVRHLIEQPMKEEKDGRR